MANNNLKNSKFLLNNLLYITLLVLFLILILSGYDYIKDIKNKNKKEKDSNIVTITNVGPTDVGPTDVGPDNISSTIEAGSGWSNYSVRVSVIEPLLTNQCSNYDNVSNYGSTNHIQYCDNMNEMPCASSGCCLLLIDDNIPSKCVAGNSSGPVTSNNNHTHYKHKNVCYNNNNPQNLDCPNLPPVTII